MKLSHGRSLVVVALLGAVSLACHDNRVLPDQTEVVTGQQYSPKICQNIPPYYPGCGCPPAPCGGAVSTPSTPDDIAQLSCAPSPVNRGDVVTCVVTLPRNHQFRGDSLVVTATEQRGDGSYPADSQYEHSISKLAGTFTAPANMPTWTSAGKAVFPTRFDVLVSATDSSGNEYQVHPFVDFAVTYPRPVFAFPAATAKLETQNRLPNKALLVRDAAGKVIGFKTVFGTTDAFLLYSGTDDADALYARYHDVNHGLGNLQVDSAVGGPNAGYKFIQDTLRLAYPVVSVNGKVYGTGPWASRQTGTFEGMSIDSSVSPVRPYCSTAVVPGLFDRLRAKVFLHEGNVAGETNHVNIWAEGLAAYASDAGRVTQRKSFPNGMAPYLMMDSLERRLYTVVTDFTKESEDQLDATFTNTIQPSLGCSFVPYKG